MGKINIIPNTKLGYLTIIEEIESIYISGKKTRMVKCKCDCGNIWEGTIYNIIYGSTKSCGCYNKIWLKENKTKHSHHIDNKPTSEYRTWSSMKQRCNNPKNKNWEYYGGRGIKVCDRWINSFENFIKDMGLKPAIGYSIDRIDVDGNYEPTNCKWSTQSEQNYNRRKYKKNTST